MWRNIRAQSVVGHDFPLARLVVQKTTKLNNCVEENNKMKAKEQ